MVRCMNIVYGGAFNPPTKAHKEIINLLFEKFNPEHVIVLPVGKDYQKLDLIDDNYRIEMLYLLDERIIVSSIESGKRFSGTYASLNELSLKYDDIYYVIGADNLINLDKWINFPKLISKYKFIVFGRDNIDALEIIEKKYSLYRTQFIYVDSNIMVSSTDFRRKKDKDLLDDEVYAYILKHHLYEEE